MRNPKIFNHDIMTCTHEAVTGNYLYCGRVLGMTEPEDMIQLHPNLKPEWRFISAHYDRIGLSHSQTVIWDVALDRLAEYSDHETSVFYFGDALNSTSAAHEAFRQLDSEWLEIVETMNCKNHFIELAEQLGVPVPKTLCYSTKAEIQFADLFYPCYLKPAVSVNGVGIYRCADSTELQQAIAPLAENIPLQIQQEVKATSFLNLQYQITPAGAERLAATEQILDGCAHIGNRYPTRHQPWDRVDPMADWMAARGMKGIFAFDVAVVETETGFEYWAIECNPRFNGASYPTGIAQKLKLESWANESFKTPCRSLAELNLAGLEYDPQRRVGVILVNWGSILVGKVGVLLAGSLPEQQLLRTALLQRLAQPVCAPATVPATVPAIASAPAQPPTVPALSST